MISKISKIEINDAPRNNESAPPKVFKKLDMVAYCGVSVISSTSRDS